LQVRIAVCTFCRPNTLVRRSVMPRATSVRNPAEGRYPRAAILTRHTRIYRVHEVAELGAVAVVFTAGDFRLSPASDARAKSQRAGLKQVDSAFHLILVGCRPRASPSNQGAIRAGAWYASQKRTDRDIRCLDGRQLARFQRERLTKKTRPARRKAGREDSGDAYRASA